MSVVTQFPGFDQFNPAIADAADSHSGMLSSVPGCGSRYGDASPVYKTLSLSAVASGSYDVVGPAPTNYVTTTTFSGSYALNFVRKTVERGGFVPDETGANTPYCEDRFGSNILGVTTLLPNEFLALRDVADLQDQPPDGFTIYHGGPFITAPFSPLNPTTFPAFPLTLFFRSVSSLEAQTGLIATTTSTDPSNSEPSVRPLDGQFRWGWGVSQNSDGTLKAESEMRQVTVRGYAPAWFNGAHNPNPHDLRGTFSYKRLFSGTQQIVFKVVIG